jgi:Leucine Rich Repeat
MTHSGQDPTSVTITSARLVDDVIVNVIRIEDSLIDKDTPDNVNAVTKKGAFLKYRLIAIVSLLVLVGMIIPAVVLTRQYPNDFPISAKDAFLEKLKLILTNSSRQELESPGSGQASALDWLFDESNFSAYSFDRQLQRFAMVAFYYSTGGTSWNKAQGWKSNDDECTWYQSGSERSCMNGTLQVLSLEKNNLKGLLRNDIALLSSLTNLNLKNNQLTVSIPSEIGQLRKLVELDLFNNSLGGFIPSEIGQIKTIEKLQLGSNFLDGSIPSEIGQLTGLELVNLSTNSLTGKIPSEIGQCTVLDWLGLASNKLDGSIPSEIGQCTKVKLLYLYDNYLDGSIPSEFASLTNLESLDILNNSLSGTIPESFCTQFTNFFVDQDVKCSCC